MYSQDHGRRAGVAILDVLTFIALVVAVYLLVRPGSELQRSVSRWREERTTRNIVRARWDDAVALAQPLYETENAPQVLEFLDYECPFCRSAAATVDSAIAIGVRVAVVQLPLSIHPLAKPAAITALCAAITGDFIKVHGTLLRSNSWQVPATATGKVVVGDSGVDSRIHDCVATGMADDILTAHIALAETLRVTATPRFVSRNGALYAPATLAALLQLAARE